MVAASGRRAVTRRDTMTTDDTNETGLTLVAIPADKIQAVIDFLASLTTEETEETDVTAHMLSRGMIGGTSVGSLAGNPQTHTQSTTTGFVALDFPSSDTDFIAG
jgi:hypothetical protein